MNIESPGPERIPALRALWKAAFGDPDSFLDSFFSLAFSPDRCRCVTEEHRVLAALYWFETTCENRKLAYLYAVATDPACRNQGLCRLLMENTRAQLRTLGFDGILLVPENEALARMYERMGFTPGPRIREFSCDAGPRAIPLRHVDAANYTALRRGLLPPMGVRQEGAALALLASQTVLLAGEGWIAAVSHEDGALRCHELLGDPGAAPGLLRALGFPRGTFRTPGGDRPFAWFLPLTPGTPCPGYFGLPLD